MLPDEIVTLASPGNILIGGKASCPAGIFFVVPVSAVILDGEFPFPPFPRYTAFFRAAPVGFEGETNSSTFVLSVRAASSCSTVTR